MKNDITQQIEALLFATAEPKSFKSLATILGVSEIEVKQSLESLEQSLSDRALMLTQNENEVVITIRPEHNTLIENIRKEELSKELSKASAETLSIIAYYNGVSRAQIEFIRGVNVSYSLRALSMRGLIESRGGGRSVGYFPTLQMLEHFGVSKIEELPQYEETFKKITDLLKQEQ